MARLAICAPRVDALAATARVIFREQLGYRQTGEGRVGDEAMGVGKGQAHGFDHEVGAIRSVRVVAQVELAQDRQRHQRGESLAVGRALEDPQSLEDRRDRLVPGDAMAGEIRLAHHAPGVSQRGDDRLADLTLIKNLAPAIGQLLEGVGQPGVQEHLTCHRCAPIDQQLLATRRLQ